MRPIRDLVPLLALSTLLLGSACATARSTPGPDRMAGCYYFVGEGAEALRLPWGVRLRAAPLEGWPALQQLEGVREATTVTPEGDRDHPFGYWRPLDGDSLEIGYPAGGGLVLTLEAEPDLSHLDGTARPVGDVRSLDAPSTPAAPTPVRLMRARCPEE